MIPLLINLKQEKEKIVNFLKSVHKKTGINKVVIGLSGGIDSTTVHYLLKKAYKLENIIGVSLPYAFIKPIVDQFEVEGSIPKFFDGKQKTAKNLVSSPFLEKIRLGNIMARVRMIILFDLAKKYDAMVCGTENKSEKLLGYFTRFGDAASDIEPISHLYKTQVYQLAKYLKVPENIIQQSPTAGLWNRQTDEDDFGFTYEEADQVLYLTHDRGQDINTVKKNFPNAKKIFKRFLDNQFKLKTPYHL